jgi:hypothetical protein
VPWYSSTSYEPAAGSQEESVAATVDAQGMCSECRIVMGHLTTCSMFKNFRYYNTHTHTRVSAD